MRTDERCYSYFGLHQLAVPQPLPFISPSLSELSNGIIFLNFCLYKQDIYIILFVPAKNSCKTLLVLYSICKIFPFKTSGPKKAPALQVVSVQSTDIPPKENVTYAKQTQTTATGVSELRDGKPYV